MEYSLCLPLDASELPTKMNHKNVTSMYIILVVDFFFVHHSSRALINYKKKHKAKVQVEKKRRISLLIIDMKYDECPS